MVLPSNFMHLCFWWVVLSKASSTCLGKPYFCYYYDNNDNDNNNNNDNGP